MGAAQSVSDNLLERDYMKVAAKHVIDHFEFPGKPIELVDLPEDENGVPSIFSKFVFYDEATDKTFVEYIEPLVSSLRHPLALCSHKMFYLVKRSFLIPPPSLPEEMKKYYFDAGASTWGKGLGGPSLSYFTSVWLRYGIDFQFIKAWEGSTAQERFMATVPQEYKSRMQFQQAWVTSNADDHTDDTPFLPIVIQSLTNKEDYVLFKLDIDSGKVELGIVDYMLDSGNDSLQHIDEFVFEHHVEGNYLLTPIWPGDTVAKGVTLHDS